MYRKALEELKIWKQTPNKKPMIIRGARQVGKTWLMKEFGRTAFQEYVYINFDSNIIMEELFAPDLDIKRIVAGMEIYFGKKIDPAVTLLIFDEIQEVPKALTSLKYFNENAPEYQILAAGSLLGVALHEGTSFPVGKVEFLDLHPLSFSEFMMALGHDSYVDLLQKSSYELITTVKHTFIEVLKQYYFVGGMPEAVQSYADKKDLQEVRTIQQRILDAYEQDFSKHAPRDVVPRIRMIWNSIPAQLAKENRKFIYGVMKEGARAKEFEMAVLWLCDCGLLYKVHRVTAPNLPLRAYEDTRAFKLFAVDVGLLSCMSRLKPEALLEGNALFREFKGALTEQYVLQQLLTDKSRQIFYWTPDQGNAEVDFLVDNGQDVIPLEVKAEVNLHAKSLKVYVDKFHPKYAVRTSMTDYKKEEWLLNLPLYAIEYL
jgi:predicted AAA+ superfamily ATPase